MKRTDWQTKFVSVVLIALVAFALAGTVQASTVYVDPTVTAWTGTGTIGNPYGSIQQAYAALWTVGGSHDIRLLAGTFTGDNIGANPWGNALIDFTDSGGTVVISGTRAANTFTLESDTGSGVTIYRNTYSGQNPWGTGKNPRGLFSVGASDLSNMTIKNVNIDLVDGAALVGKAFGGTQGFTFDTVNVFLQSTAALYGSGLYVVDSGVENTDDLKFTNSKIYMNPVNTWDYDIIRFGNDGGTMANTSAIIDGNNTSRIYAWSGTGSYTDPTQYSIVSDLTSFYAVNRNPDTYGWARNGSNSAGNNANSTFFINNFLLTDNGGGGGGGAVPEPSVVLLLAAGGGLLFRRYRQLIS